MYVLPIDLETSLHNTGETAVGDFAADPFHPDNWIVWSGWCVLDDQLKQVGDAKVKRYQKGEVAIPAPNLDNGPCVVTGHNIGFDILHLCNPNNKHWSDWVAWLNDPRALLWDTQAVEYRLLGQSVAYPSQDFACERRGWPLKPGRLKEYWKEGISTEDIPDEEVRPYMQHDAETAARLFKRQVSEVRSRGMMQIVRVENDAILATTLMRYNGMKFDKGEAMRVYEEELAPQIEQLTEDLKAAFEQLTGIPQEFINPNSNPFLTKVLYGGEQKFDIKGYILNDDGEYTRYKSGKKKGELRMRNIEVRAQLPRRVTGDYEGSGEEVLQKIKAAGACDDALAPVFDKVLELRNLSKLAKTYFYGYSKLTWPDGCIHGSLNHAVTVTSRLSSTAPNLQNAGHTPVRKCFVSRYEGGKLLEVDLSQIEVVVQAFLSQDENMIADIINGVDFHCKRAAYAAGVEYETVLEGYKNEDAHWTKERKGAKQFSFQRAYGAGAPAISESTGLDIGLVYKLIEAEEALYSKVKEVNEEWIRQVNHSVKERDGIIAGVLRSPTGTEYRFAREPDQRGRMTIKPTIVKNYPIQGMAADIIKLILARIRQFLFEYNTWIDPADGERSMNGAPVLVVNTVHDSVIFDVPAQVVLPHLAGELITLFTEGVLGDLSRRLGIDFNVPIRADAEAGDNWYEMEVVDAAS